MVRRRRVLWIAVVALLAGCAVAPAHSGEPDPGYLTWLHRHARDVLARFDKAVRDAGGSPRFVALGAVSQEEGGWRDDERDAQRAFQAGLVVLAKPLPAAPHPTGKVVWDNGETMPIPLISAGAALNQLAAESRGDCPGCAPVEIVATLSVLGGIATTHGPATIPAWVFAAKDTPFSVVRPAFSMSTVVRVDPMSWESVNLPGQQSPLRIDSATAPSASSRQLTVAFVGAKGPASQVCGIDYTTEAVESDYAVAVIVIPHAHPSGDYGCTMVGYPRTAIVNLARPLGDRAILQTQQGLPVPVTITE